MKMLPKIAVTALAALVLTSCGGGSSSSGKDAGSDPSSTGSSSSSPSPSGSASTTDDNTASPATGQAMSGQGYKYNLPDSWEDISTQLKQSQPGIDTGGRAKPATPPFTANLNTLTTPSQLTGAPSDSDLKKLAAQLKQEVASLAPTVKTFPATSIDGSPAVHQEGKATQGSTKFFLVQYFVVHSGNNYGVTFAFPSSSTQSSRDKVVLPVLSSFKFS